MPVGKESGKTEVQNRLGGSCGPDLNASGASHAPVVPLDSGETLTEWKGASQNSDLSQLGQSAGRGRNNAFLSVCDLVLCGETRCPRLRPHMSRHPHVQAPVRGPVQGAASALHSNTNYSTAEPIWTIPTISLDLLS